MRDQIEEVKSAVDLLQIIGERVSLNRAGKSYKGLCPFHSEKTPSFFVTPDIQRYKCFGCGKTGDVFTFLQEYDSLTFGEALEQLAKRAGITLERKVFSSEDIHRQRLYEVLHLAGEYYHYLLTSHKLGERARAYAKNRGITSATINTFKLGVSLNSWDALQKYLIDKKKYTERELVDAGLILYGSRNSRPYDRFRDRLMFPLTDHQGRVVGFSGRVLDASIKEAKYINSPETQLYHKSQLLFGYSILKNIIKKEEEVIVVEGELDALSSYQAGVEHVVAIKGSALTDAQAKLLSRTVKRVVLALDADMAGREATARAIQVVQPYDLNLRVLPLIGGKDPDEIAKDHPKTWREMTKQTISAYHYLIDCAFVDHDNATGEGKRAITKALLPVLASIGNAVEQAYYIEYAAKKLEIKVDALEMELKKYFRAVKLGGVGVKKQEHTHAEKQRAHAELLERYIVSLLLHADDAFIRSKLDGLELGDGKGKDPRLSKLVDLLRAYAKHHTFVLQEFSRQVPAELQQVLSEVYMEEDFLHDTESPEYIVKEWEKTLPVYQQEVRAERLQEFSERLAELDEKDAHDALTPEEKKTLEKIQAEVVRLSALYRAVLE